MAINTKRPSVKESVGAQYVSFDKMENTNDFTGQYETDVEKTEVVKKISVQEATESSDVYASGVVYATNTMTSSIDVTVDVVAFPNKTLHKMKGSLVNANGLVQSGASRKRPFFAYGKVVKLSNGKERFDWYPKCQLTSNTDDAETKEAGTKEQNDTLTIKALPFNDAGDIVMSVNTDDHEFENLTEAKFFAKPILTSADFDAVIAVAG